MYRAELDLDDGRFAEPQRLSLHLAAPRSLAGGTMAPGGGQVSRLAAPVQQIERQSCFFKVAHIW